MAANSVLIGDQPRVSARSLEQGQARDLSSNMNQRMARASNMRSSGNRRAKRF